MFALIVYLKESNKTGSDAALYECCYMEETATKSIEGNACLVKVSGAHLIATFFNTHPFVK